MADDVIDELLAILPGDRLDTVRRARTQARDNAQAGYEALFEPVDAAEVSLVERHLVAQVVAGLSGEPLLTDFYRAGAVERGAAAEAAVVDAVIADAAGTSGPYGRYTEPGLAGEDTDGPRLAPIDGVGPRLGAAVAHAHLLVFRPREASREALQQLLDAGWSTTGVVTLSQLIAFVSFQLRLIQGLGALQSEIEGDAA